MTIATKPETVRLDDVRPDDLRQNAALAKAAQQDVRVMQIITNLDIGGAQEVVHTLAKYLAQEEACQPLVCAFRGGPLLDPIRELGIPVEILPARRYSVLALPLFLADMIRLWRALTRLIRQYKVDVIQTHLLRSLDFLILLLPFATRVRAVFWTFHSANFELTAAKITGPKWLLSPKRTIHRWLYKISSRHVGGYVAISEQVGQSMAEVLGPVGSKIHVLNNGVDTERYGSSAAIHRERDTVRRELGLPADACLIAQVGTLKEVKGHRFMIEAMPQLFPAAPNLHLLVIGDGELRSTLETQIAQLNLGGHVHLLGSRHDVPRLLGASDLFVLPSLWEGLSMALLEAMASGLPIVASRVSGTIQAIVPGETGLLVPPGEVAPLVEALNELLSDPARARAMGTAAQAHVQATFSAQKQAREHLALYRRVLGAPPAS